MDKKTKTILTMLTIAVVINIGMGFYAATSVISLEQRVSLLEEEQQRINVGEARSVNNTTQGGIGTILVYSELESTGKVVEYQYWQIPNTIDTYIETGRIQIGDDFQASIENAKEAVVRAEEYEPETTGIQLSFRAPRRWESIGGQSASLAIAAQIAAFDPQYEVNQSVILTGDVKPNGMLQQVRALDEKAEAAAEYGKTTVVVPQTRSPITTSNEVTVHYVSTLQEALEIALDKRTTSQ